MWPFLALYTLWGWRARPAMRWVLAGGWAFVLFMWFGIPAITSRTAFVAASNAFGSGRAPHGNKVVATISRFLDINHPLLEVVALGAVALAVVRRDRTTLVLAAGAVVWVIVEIAFALHGWPGLARYMFPAGAVVAVLAGVAVGRLVNEVPWRWAGAAVALALAVALVPSALNHVRDEHRDLRGQRARTQQIKRLAGQVSAAGGASLLRSCGEPLTRLEFQTILAWTLRAERGQGRVQVRAGRGQPAARRPLHPDSPRRVGGPGAAPAPRGLPASALLRRPHPPFAARPSAEGWLNHCGHGLSNSASPPP